MQAEMLASLLDMPPPMRNAFLIEMPPQEYAAVTGAAHDLLGTPFGLWADDYKGFVELGLGDSLYDVQYDIGQSVCDNERTAVPSAHGTGKTHGASRIVAWFVCVHPPGTAKVITTATKWSQVELQLWPHIRAIHERANLPGRCLLTRWLVGDLDYPAAYGLSPDDRDETGFSGIHDPHVLAVVDEAGGLSPILGESLNSILSGEHGRLLLIGNPPIDETGTTFFEDQCNKASYNVIRIPASVTPNFTEKPTPLCAIHPEMDAHPISQHLVQRKWVEMVREDYGEDDPYYIARVMAEFPKDLESKVIPRTWLEESKTNTEPDHSSWVRLGVDIASDGGDEFVIARAEGFTIKVVHNVRGSANANALDVAGVILEHIEQAEDVRRTLGSDRPVRVKIDADGIGWGVKDTLLAWKSEGRHKAQIIAVRSGQKCETKTGQEQFANKRAEMWWNGRLLSQPRKDDAGEVSPPVWKLDVTDTEVRQLGAPKRKTTSDGRRLTEKKEDMRKRGVQSPDRADAILLAVYEPAGSGRGRLSLPSGRVPRAGQ